jgi:hypothetical protein
MFLYFGGRLKLMLSMKNFYTLRSERSLEKRYKIQKGQPRMDNQETLPTLGTPQSRKTK